MPPSLSRLTGCLPRRSFLRSAVSAAAAVATGPAGAATVSAGKDLPALETRRELFVDRYLIDRTEGALQQRLHHPVPREIAIRHDTPWEGTGCGYHSIFQDGDRYRMYYKAWHLDPQPGRMNTGRHPLYCCCAESPDGIHWHRPQLGLYDFQGSKDNNIVMTSGPLGPIHVDAGHPAVFRDENPDVPDSARYKAIFRSVSPNGLLPFRSPDGLRWSPMTDAPILSGLGVFDSQNLAFWDPGIGRYRAYWRYFTKQTDENGTVRAAGTRAIRTATSDDLIHWDQVADLTYEDSPSEHLYTNQIKPYHRADHLLIGFPTRYIERGWSESMKALPALEQRRLRASSVERYGTALTEGLFMSSRNGTHFHRWNEAFLRPGPERPDAWHYGHQYIGWHLVETRPSLPGGPNELSLYATEGYWHGTGSLLRRYTLRLDGFVSLHAGADGGRMISRPFTFSGTRLQLNFASSAAGGVRVGLQSPDGTEIEGHSLKDCHVLFGDSVARTVAWKQGTDLSGLRGRPVRLVLELHDADVYAMQFIA